MIKLISDTLAQYPEIKVAFIFGSVARGQERPESDLDLAIAGDKEFSPDFKVDLINELSTKIKREIDLIDLSTATGTVAKEALHTGKLIINKDPLRLARILSRLIVEEEDFQKLCSRLMKLRRKKAFDVA